MLPQQLQPFLSSIHDQHHGHGQRSLHLGSTYSEPKQFYNLLQGYLELLLQHMPFQPQFYVGPSYALKRILGKNKYVTCTEVMCTTSRLPASPKYTGRSKARPTATLSLLILANMEKQFSSSAVSYPKSFIHKKQLQEKCSNFNQHIYTFSHLVRQTE